MIITLSKNKKTITNLAKKNQVSITKQVINQKRR